MTSSNDIIIIGIAGASGSGKSLLSNTIVNELGSSRVSVISEDSYYRDLKNLKKDERDQVNFDHPDAMDHDFLCEQLKQLREGQSIEVPEYDYSTHTRSANSKTISNSHKIIVLEGILLLTVEKIRQQLDISIYVDTDLDLCFIRRLKRDVIERGRTMESVVQQYQSTVRPMFMQFIEPTKRYADLIVPHGGKNRIAIELIQAKIKEMLNQH